jgi:hypothetical protein
MLRFTEKLKGKSDIYSFMCKHGKTLSSKTDFASEITIEHLDGSKFDLRNGSWDECEEKIYVWTEHCGYLYFYKDDLRQLESKRYEWDEKEGKFHLLEHTIMTFNYNV